MSGKDFKNCRIRLNLWSLYDEAFNDNLVYQFARMLYSSIVRVAKFVHKDGQRYRYALKNNRYVNPRYYTRYKNLQFPKGKKWVLITLTLSRDIDIVTAWSKIGVWTSQFLHNLRTHFYRKGKKIPYFWVIEPHEDGYPHVHILIAFPFLPIEKLKSWWSYSEGQGVDVRFIGSDYEQVKNYVLKYLLKSQYADFSIDFKRGYIEFGLVPFLLWACRVRLLGRSRGFILNEAKKLREWFYVETAIFYDDVVEDVMKNLKALGINYDIDELQSLLVSFLQQSGLVFKYEEYQEEPIDYQLDEDLIDF